MEVWKIGYAVLDTERLDKLLAEGWEPFAIVPNDECDLVFLKKRMEETE